MPTNKSAGEAAVNVTVFLTMGDVAFGPPLVLTTTLWVIGIGGLAETEGGAGVIVILVIIGLG